MLLGFVGKDNCAFREEKSLTLSSCKGRIVGDITVNLRWKKIAPSQQFQTEEEGWIFAFREGFEHTKPNHFQWMIYGAVRNIGVDFEYNDWGMGWPM